MPALARDIAIGVVLAAILFPILAYTDDDSALRGPQLLWIAPVVGVLVGLLGHVRRRGRRAARRAGAKAAGRDPDAAEAAGDQSVGDLWRRSPALTVGLLVLLVAVVALTIWVRVAR